MADEPTPTPSPSLPTPQPTPAPQAPAPKPPPPEAFSGTEPGWAPGAWERFQAVTRENKAIKQRLEGGELIPREQVEQQVQATRAEVTARYQQEIALERAAAAAPNLRHDSVRSLFRRGYQEHAASEREAGREVPDFGAWLSSDAVKSDPVYGVHLAAPAAAPEQSAPPTTVTPPRPAPSDPNKGAGDAPTPTPGNYTPEEIAKAASNPAEFRRHQAKIREALEAKLGKPLGSRRVQGQGGT